MAQDRAALKVIGQDVPSLAIVGIAILGLLLMIQAVELGLKPKASTISKKPTPPPQIPPQIPKPAVALAPPKAPAPKKPKLCTPIFEILFRENSERAILPQGLPERINAWLRAHPSRSFVIEGHANASGPQTHNLRLSYKRAERVRNLLRRAKVSERKLSARAFGEFQPLAGIPESSVRNRRVVIRSPGLPACEGPPAQDERGAPQ